MIEIPPIVRNKAVAAGSEVWLDGLVDLIRDLERAWDITVGAPFADGTEAYVAEATLADGTPAVLKLVVPRAGNHARNEITVLRHAAGDGCVDLLRDDIDRGAMLLERLGPSMFELGLPIERRLEILCDAAAQLWCPVLDIDLPTGAYKARWLAEQVATMWEELDRPCSERAVEHALTCADRRERAHDDERAVLVHGDVHQWNALRAGQGHFKLVDPDGLVAEPEYDLGIIMREDPIELVEGDPYDRAHWLAARTGSDATATWEWGVVERVSTGLLATKIDLQPAGADMLDAADHVAIGPH